MSKFKRIILLSFCLINKINAQLSIDTTYSAEYLVKDILVGKYENLKIENIECACEKKSIGIFTWPMKYNKMISRGIVLSTGDVFEGVGPNNSSNTSSKSLINSDNDLSSIANGKTFDAAILEFDFVPVNDSICFRFFFASEEYPEYVNKNVNDVFGFFLSCKEFNTSLNLAVIEDNIPITVDNINANTNSKYFIENSKWDSGNIQNWRNDKQKGELAYTFQFDGFTVVLNAGAKVVAGKKYHIKIAIADVGDRLYDSAIFLEAGSFRSVSTDLNFEQIISNEFVGAEIAELKNGISINLNVNFEADSFKVSNIESFEMLDRIVKVLNCDTSMVVEVIGHTDDNGKKEYNKILSLNRAKNVADYLISKGLESDRIKYEGLGDLHPISQTDRSLNRRVEFVFIKKKL